MLTKTALAEKFKGTVAEFARSRVGKAANSQPYLKDALVGLVYPLLAAAWAEGHAEAEAGIPAGYNPYT